MQPTPKHRHDTERLTDVILRHCGMIFYVKWFEHGKNGTGDFFFLLYGIIAMLVFLGPLSASILGGRVLALLNYRQF